MILYGVLYVNMSFTSDYAPDVEKEQVEFQSL